MAVRHVVARHAMDLDPQKEFHQQIPQQLLVDESDSEHQCIQSSWQRFQISVNELCKMRRDRLINKHVRIAIFDRGMKNLCEAFSRRNVHLMIRWATESYRLEFVRMSAVPDSCQPSGPSFVAEIPNELEYDIHIEETPDGNKIFEKVTDALGNSTTTITFEPFDSAVGQNEVTLKASSVTRTVEETPDEKFTLIPSSVTRTIEVTPDGKKVTVKETDVLGNSLTIITLEPFDSPQDVNDADPPNRMAVTTTTSANDDATSSTVKPTFEESPNRKVQVTDALDSNAPCAPFDDSFQDIHPGSVNAFGPTVKTMVTDLPNGGIRIVEQDALGNKLITTKTLIMAGDEDDPLMAVSNDDGPIGGCVATVTAVAVDTEDMPTAIEAAPPDYQEMTEEQRIAEAIRRSLLVPVAVAVADPVPMGASSTSIKDVNAVRSVKLKSNNTTGGALKAQRSQSRSRAADVSPTGDDEERGMTDPHLSNRSMHQEHPYEGSEYSGQYNRQRSSRSSGSHSGQESRPSPSSSSGGKCLSSKANQGGFGPRPDDSVGNSSRRSYQSEDEERDIASPRLSNRMRERCRQGQRYSDRSNLGSSSLSGSRSSRGSRPSLSNSVSASQGMYLMPPTQDSYGSLLDDSGVDKPLANLYMDIATEYDRRDSANHDESFMASSSTFEDGSSNFDSSFAPGESGVLLDEREEQKPKKKKKKKKHKHHSSKRRESSKHQKMESKKETEG